MNTAALLGLGWGAAAATGARTLLIRRAAGWRARRLAASTAVPAADRRRARPVFAFPLPAAVRSVGRRLHDRNRARARMRAIERALPMTVDLLALGVSAGLTPFLAVDAAAHTAPPVIAEILRVALGRVGAGMRFSAALDAMVIDAPTLRPVANALLASERLGAPVAPALQQVALEARAAARRRAEVHARRVPIRLLFPLVFLVLPAFALLTVVPAVLSGFAR